MRENSILLWNGFIHRWKNANHRMARLGNGIRKLTSAETIALEQARLSLMNSPFINSNPFPGFDADEDQNYQLTHYAASGSDADTAEYTSFYTSVQSPSDHISFVTGESTLNIAGAENADNSAVIAVSGTFPAFAAGQNVEGRFLLNGYDIVRTANQEAKKYNRLRIWFTNENFDAQQGTFSANLNVTLNASCRSAECWGVGIPGIGNPPPNPGDQNAMEYTANVSWVFAIGDDTELAVEDRNYQETMNWPNKDWNPDNHFLVDHQRQDALTSQANFPVFCAAFNELEFDLEMTGGHIHQLSNEESFHMLEIATTLRTQSGIGGDVLDYALFFKNWKRPMINQGLLNTAYGVAGNATMNAGVSILRFSNAATIVRQQEHSDSFAWNTTHGSNADPNVPEAQHSHYANLALIAQKELQSTIFSLTPNTSDQMQIELPAEFAASEIEVTVDMTNAPDNTWVQLSTKEDQPLRLLDLHNFYPVNHYKRDQYLFNALKTRDNFASVKSIRMAANEARTLGIECGIGEIPSLTAQNHFYMEGKSVVVQVKRFGQIVHEATIFLRYFISPFVGNSNATPCPELHLFGCEYEQLMANANRVPYYSIADAHADGYDNGHYCLGGSTC